MDIQEIVKRRKKLKEVSQNLKDYFVGIDHIIDKVISNIEIWYLMPELLDRPVPINLWGITGVGKTDLVRKLVTLLGYDDKYVEVQLDTGTESNSWNGDKIKNQIDDADIKETDQAIVLLDEIQRFRTIDENGNMINNSKYQDIWMLLSDGKFNDRDTRLKELSWVLYDLLFDDDRAENSPSEEEDPNSDTPLVAKKNKSNLKYQTSVWSADRFKKSIDSDMSLEEVMKLTTKEKITLVKEKIHDLKNNGEYEFKKYNKMLIFISGNIDEAFTIADDVAETTLDADICHEFTKQISIIDIKLALKKKFKPEQIARFGNIHIIYPTLSKNSYETLIDRKLDAYADKAKNLHGFDINFSKELKSELYVNGVFPMQGVRPLFSTIASIIGNSIPNFMMEAKINNKSCIDISHDDQTLIALISNPVNDDGFISERKVNFDITYLKNNIDENKLYRTCVHEAGHAIIYGHEFKKTPLQIIGNSVNGESNGSVVPSKHSNSKNEFISEVKVFLAGTVAEEIVFGKDNKSSGNSEDLKRATRSISNMFRKFNMYSTIGLQGNQYNGQSLTDTAIMNIESSNGQIETTLKNLKNEVESTLVKYKQFLIDLTNELVDKKELSPIEYYKIAKNYIDELEIKNDNKPLIPNYKAQFENFANPKVEITELETTN